MNKTWGLFVPTYKRKNPLILEMLQKDKTLTINLCVRREELESGFYDDLKSNAQINIVDLGYNLTELGLTRKRIIDYCIANDIRYCFMFDDGISSVDDSEHPSYSISQVFNNIIDIMQNDEYSENVVGFTFVKRRFIDNVTGKYVTKRNRHLADRNYFLTYAGQAVCLDTYKLNEHHISYHSLDEVGFEDAAMLGDTIKAGLIWCSRKSISIDGVIPNVQKPGGSHSDNFKIETKYDKHNKLCIDYLNMMGIYLVKKYEGYMSSYCSFIKWDFDYFNDVLVTYRKQNSKIIKSKFKKQ